MLTKIALPIDDSLTDIIHPCLLPYLNCQDAHIIKAWYMFPHVILVLNRHHKRYIIINIFNNIRHYLTEELLMSEEEEGAGAGAKEGVEAREGAGAIEGTGAKEGIIWRSIDTFQQNDCAAAITIHAFVTSKLRSADAIYGIGGEFYLYFILGMHHYTRFYGYSNHQRIIEVAEMNLSKYLSKRYRLKYIIIITCDQDKYNKRRHLIEDQYRLHAFEHIMSAGGIIVSAFCYSRQTK
jgi:hypothetical protein